jgi:hypothetical protein
MHEFWDFSCISNVRVEKGRHMSCALHRSPFPPAGVKSSPQVECQEVAPTLRSVRDRKAGSARTAESVYYIDDTNGNDTRSDLEAQDPATPWKTIGRGIQAAVAGDTVIVQPGDYYESVESIRDGLPDAPIIIQAGHFSAL